jgi:hypothetical protein
MEEKWRCDTHLKTFLTNSKGKSKAKMAHQSLQGQEWLRPYDPVSIGLWMCSTLRMAGIGGGCTLQLSPSLEELTAKSVSSSVPAVRATRPSFLQEGPLTHLDQDVLNERELTLHLSINGTM